MKSLRTRVIKASQAGFTLIELVIVIVIIGILAAVAIPQFSSVSTEAERAKGVATLGAVKSAWAGAFAVAKGTPTIAQVTALLTVEPTCTGTGPLICTYGTGGNAVSYSITVGSLATGAFSCTDAECDKQ